jgi:hypothetical protein
MGLLVRMGLRARRETLVTLVLQVLLLLLLAQPARPDHRVRLVIPVPPVPLVLPDHRETRVPLGLKVPREQRVR